MFIQLSKTWCEVHKFTSILAFELLGGTSQIYRRKRHQTISARKFEGTENFYNLFEAVHMAAKWLKNQSKGKLFCKLIRKAKQSAIGLCLCYKRGRQGLYNSDLTLFKFQPVFPSCAIFCSKLQLKERLSTGEEGHQAEQQGMKQQIANMTAELHKR